MTLWRVRPSIMAMACLNSSGSIVVTAKWIIEAKLSSFLSAHTAMRLISFRADSGTSRLGSCERRHNRREPLRGHLDRRKDLKIWPSLWNNDLDLG